APSVALGILFVPIFDTLRVSVIRVMKGMSPFAPDKNHIHHRILAMGFRQMSTVLLLGFINGIVILFVLSFSDWGNFYLLLALLAFSLVLSLFLGVYKARGARSIAS